MAFEIFTPDASLNAELATIKQAAFAEVPFFRFTFPTHDVPAMESWYREREMGRFEDPACRIIAIREASTGTLVGWLRWSQPSGVAHYDKPENQWTQHAPPDGTKMDTFHRLYDDLAIMERKWMDASKDWELLTLAVDPKFKGRGYGNALVQHLSREADRVGATMFLASTSPAEPLYRKRGFQEKDRMFVDMDGQRDSLTVMIREPQPPSE